MLEHHWRHEVINVGGFKKNRDGFGVLTYMIEYFPNVLLEVNIQTDSLRSGV